MRPRDLIRRVQRGRPQYVLEALPSRHTIEEIVRNLPNSYEYFVEPVWYRRKEKWFRILAMPPKVSENSVRLPALYAVDLHFSLHRELVRELLRQQRAPEWYKIHEPWVLEEMFHGLMALDVTSDEFLAHLIDRLSRCQALGNVNHRTAIYLTEVLAAYVHIKMERPLPREPKSFVKDRDTFIARSKTILKSLENVHAPRQHLVGKHLEYARELVGKSRQLQSMARATDSRAALDAFITDWGKLT